MSSELSGTVLVEEQDTILDEYLSFISDDLRFAVSAKYVTEIIKSFTVTILPRVPSYIKGIFNLRGQVIPIVDARARMRQSPGGDGDAGKCVIVLNNESGEVAIGFLVDGVSHVVNISDDEILPPPANNRQELVNGIAHIEGSDYLILDCAKLIG